MYISASFNIIILSHESPLSPWYLANQSGTRVESLDRTIKDEGKSTAYMKENLENVHERPDQEEALHYPKVTGLHHSKCFISVSLLMKQHLPYTYFSNNITLYFSQVSHYD